MNKYSNFKAKKNWGGFAPPQPPRRFNIRGSYNNNYYCCYYYYYYY